VAGDRSSTSARVAGVGVYVGSKRLQGVEVVGGAPVEPGTKVAAVGGSGGALVAQEKGAFQSRKGDDDAGRRLLIRSCPDISDPGDQPLVPAR